MARHNYKYRPDPIWKDGLFYPSSPVPIAKPIGEWDFIDTGQNLSALVNNPIEATSLYSMEAMTATATTLGMKMMVPADPEVIRYLFVTNAENLALHSVRQALLRPILKDGLITASGDQWKRARHLLSPVFTPKHTKSFASSMSKTSERVLPELFPEAGNGQSILLSSEMLKLAYAVLSDTLFSGEIEEDASEVLKSIATFLAVLGRPDVLDILKAPEWIPRLSRLKGQKDVKKVRAMIVKAIAARTQTKSQGGELPDDFLTLLLNSGDDVQAPLSDVEIEDNILTFIGAGHETTSRALTWMLYLLSNDTKARDRAEAEVDALDTDTIPPQDWVNHLPWSMACFEETMRLYPPAPFISRTIIEDDTFKEHEFTKGQAILVNLWALHRHTKIWDNPNAFDPRRFLPEARKKINRFSYLTFGMGRRVCIGQRFALQEAAVLMVHMLRGYRFDYAGERPPWPKMRTTVQSDNLMPMTVTRRDPL